MQWKVPCPNATWGMGVRMMSKGWASGMDALVAVGRLGVGDHRFAGTDAGAEVVDVGER
ncbi:hypothetical protein ACIBSV_36080 [Embleya sp. NPDC050154]|uniref:hypothetical protein n=1 Tax=unclassified Embleya TaxID=2699296 RepID=UPI0037A85F3E